MAHNNSSRSHEASVFPARKVSSAIMSTKPAEIKAKRSRNILYGKWAVSQNPAASKILKYNCNAFLATPNFEPSGLESEADSDPQPITESPQTKILVKKRRERPERKSNKLKIETPVKGHASLELVDPHGGIFTPPAYKSPMTPKRTYSRKKMRRITIVGEYNNEEENEEDYDEKDEVQKGAGEFSISTQSSRVDTPSEPDSLDELFDWGSNRFDGLGVEFEPGGTPKSSKKSILVRRSAKPKLILNRLKKVKPPPIRQLNEGFMIDLTEDPSDSEVTKRTKTKRGKKRVKMSHKNKAEEVSDTVSVDAGETSSSGSTEAADPLMRKDWVSFNCLISKTKKYFDRLREEMSVIRDTTKFTEEQLNFFTRKTFAKFLAVLKGEEECDNPKYWRHREFMAKFGNRKEAALGRRLVLMSNPRSHFTEQQQDVCTYVLNAIITAACQKNRTNPKFPLHTEMDIVNYLSEVMLPEILFRLYAKAKQLPYAKAKRLTETTQEHNRGKAS